MKFDNNLKYSFKLFKKIYFNWNKGIRKNVLNNVIDFKFVLGTKKIFFLVMLIGCN